MPMEHLVNLEPLTDPDTAVANEDVRPRGGRANEIRNALQEEIESGKLPPGSPLDERALAARFLAAQRMSLYTMSRLIAAGDEAASDRAQNRAIALTVVAAAPERRRGHRKRRRRWRRRGR